MVSNQILPVWSNSMLNRPSGALGLNFLMGYSVNLSVFGSNLPIEHLAEVRIPDVAVLIDQDVVRLGCLAPHVVFGDDGAGVAARRARQSLELVCPVIGRAEIDGGEILGHLAVLLGRAGARAVEHRLRLDRLADRAVAHHAGDDVRPFVGVMRRAHDAFQGVAARAVEQRRLLLFGARACSSSIRHW